MMLGSTAHVRSFHSSGASTWFDRRVNEVAGFGLDNQAGRTGWINHVTNTSTDAVALESTLAQSRLPLYQMVGDEWLVSTFSGTARWQNCDDRFGAGWQLTGINVAESVPACGKVGVTLRWHADTKVTTDYTLSVTLLDQLGGRIGQEDGLPVGESWPTSRWNAGDTATGTRWITVPPNIPAGEIELS